MNLEHGGHSGWSSRRGSGLTLHHVVGPQNLNELKSVHEQAENTAIIYISTIIILYILGLLVILFHHMNQTHGVWSWNCLDVWDEIRPWSSSTLVSSTVDEGISSKPGIEIVIESVYDETSVVTKKPPKRGWRKARSNLCFFRRSSHKKKNESTGHNSNLHHHHSESSVYHTKDSRDDLDASEGFANAKEARGMSVVTILDDEHSKQGKSSLKKSEVLETAL